MTSVYSRYLAQRTNQITDILAVDSLVDDQETAIYELLSDISDECEIIIKKVFIGGVERITAVDINPKSVNLFQEFQEQADREFMVVGKLFLGFLYCERFGDSQPLYDALQEYKRVTNYPITGTDTEDKEWMLLESGMLLEQVLSTVLKRYSVGEPEKTALERLVDRFRLQVLENNK